MPLEKSEIRVPFGGGLDTKTDHKQVIPGQLIELKNGVFHELKQITKRNGFLAPWSDWTVDSDTIEAGNAVYRRGKELLITGLQTRSDVGRLAWEDGRHMFTHGPDEDEWKIIGEREPLRIDTEHIVSSKIEWDIPDMALADANKYACYAYISGGGLAYQPGVTYYNHGHVTVRELANDDTLIDDYIYDGGALAAVNTSGIHVVGIDATNPIFYVWLAVPSANDVYLSQINCLTLTEPGAPAVKINNDLHADMIWDVCTATHTTHGECSVVAYKDIDGFLTVKWFDEDGTEQDSQTGTLVIKGALTVYEEYDHLTATNKVVTSYQSNANGFIYGTVFNADATVYIGGNWDFEIYGVDAGIVEKMTGCKDEAADHYNWHTRSYLRLYVEIAVKEGGALLDSWWQSRILELQHEFDGSNPNLLTRNRHARLASKAFAHESKPRVWVVHDSSGALVDAATDIYSNTYQNTFFLCSPGDFIQPQVHQRTDARCYGLEAGVNGLKSISAVVSPETDKYCFAALKEERSVEFDALGDGGSVRRSQDSIVEISTEFNQYAQPGTEMGPNLQTGGGFVGVADGRFQELGFHLYPMIQELSDAGGGAGADVVWQYIAVYEWIDREGQRHQSAPSLPVTIECKDDEQVTIEVMSLSFGDWEKLRSTKVVVYRTLDAGDLFYRLPAESCPTNNPIVYTMLAFDGGGLAANPISDAILAENEALYTTGGIVENLCPPATSIMNVRQDRVMLVPDEDRTDIWFSKLKQHEVGVSFSGFFTKRVSDGGDITALVTMDTREIVFKESEIRAFSGAGPIDTGVGTFSEDYQITSDVGCISRASVVWMDKGIMFKSHKGIYLLGRNLQVSYIGAPVEEYNTQTVLKAELVENKNQVRFLLEGQSMLVYDYLVNQWSVFEAPQSGESFVPWDTVDSAIWQDTYVMIKDDGTVYREGLTWVDVTDTYIPLDLTSSWIKLNGLQGYQRVWWISLLGEVYTQCTINYEIFYDYIETNPQVGSVVIDANFAATPPAQFRIKPRYGNGKCQAFKIRLWDEEAAVPAGIQKGYSISDFMIQIGKKSGVMRQGTLKTR